ncbi:MULTISPECIES: glycosyltransferase [unclassified Photobacterium]|uniref:glycosyltransferase n=1 Tax=unclassified Photobacterium TaxID=2628852 RepID=UPI001EDD3961|nr:MULTISPECIES: glycosyltransferase [unclassified Photobacterium]MCG3864917.1 glycosyltransferase [Photobacterium sp. Ph6]MCG3876325.1 glycosyltransferase [Photobacterium sp. Ph5]
MSEKQKSFYESLGAKRLYKISPYIPDENENKNKNNVIGNEKVRFLISGFPISIYRLKESIYIFSRLSKAGKIFHLDICLYGFDYEGLQSEIISLASTLPSYTIFTHLNEKEFNRVLSATDIYLRLNSVDSFGLIVAEAISKGINVITTDVCERYPGSNLVAVDDFETVYSEINYYIKFRKMSGTLPIQQKVVSEIDYDEFLDVFLEP